MAGLVALVTMATLDALSPHYDPDPWVYAIGPLVVWGPGMLPGIGRRG